MMNATTKMVNVIKKIYEVPDLRMTGTGRVGGLMEVTERGDEVTVKQMQEVPGTFGTSWVEHFAVFPRALWDSLNLTKGCRLVEEVHS